MTFSVPSIYEAFFSKSTYYSSFLNIILIIKVTIPASITISKSVNHMFSMVKTIKVATISSCFFPFLLVSLFQLKLVVQRITTKAQKESILDDNFSQQNNEK